MGVAIVRARAMDERSKLVGKKSAAGWMSTSVVSPGILPRLEIPARPGDARCGRHKGRFERALARHRHAAVLGRAVVVQAGDGLIRHRGQVVRRHVEQVGELQEQMGCPAAHLVVGEGRGGQAGFAAEGPADVVGQRLDPAGEAAGGANIDAALAMNVDGVGDDHGPRVGGGRCGRQGALLHW